MTTSTVGIYAKTTNVKDAVIRIAHDSGDSITTPAVMLLGRIIKVIPENANAYHFSIVGDKAAEGIRVTGLNEITLDEGYSIEVGTGISPKGWRSERKVIVDGPIHLRHGDIVVSYTEANSELGSLASFFVESKDETLEVA